MVLSCVDLSNGPAHPGTIVPDYDKEILWDESHFAIRLDDLHVCEPLSVRAHLVLALDNQDAPVAQDSVGFSTCFLIQL